MHSMLLLIPKPSKPVYLKRHPCYVYPNAFFRDPIGTISVPCISPKHHQIIDSSINRMLEGSAAEAEPVNNLGNATCRAASKEHSWIGIECAAIDPFSNPQEDWEPDICRESIWILRLGTLGARLDPCIPDGTYDTVKPYSDRVR